MECCYPIPKPPLSRFRKKSGKWNLLAISKNYGIHPARIKNAVSDGVNPEDEAAIQQWLADAGKRWSASLVAAADKRTGKSGHKKKMKELHARGYGLKETAKQVGIPYGRAKCYARELGITFKENLYANMNALAEAERLIMAGYYEERRKVKIPDNAWIKPWYSECARITAAKAYRSNRDEGKARAKTQYEKNKHKPEYIAKKRVALKRWKLENPEKVKTIRSKWASKPHNKIGLRLRGRLREFIGYKIGSHSAIFGCSPRELRAWLESQFEKGMSWGNYGEWHIDHRVPCRAFNLQDRRQAMLCFHYSNLQPMWAFDNMSKGGKMPANAQLPLMV